MELTVEKGKSLVVNNANFQDSKVRYSDYFGVYPIYAPADFNLENQPFNLAEVFHKSKIPCKRFAFTIADTATSITFAAKFRMDYASGINDVHLFQTVDGVAQESVHNRNATVELTEGSTNRYAIVAGPKIINSSSPTVSLVDGSNTITRNVEWLHIGDSITTIEQLYNNPDLKIITCDNPSLIKTFYGRFSPANGGVLDIQESVKAIGYGYGGQIKAAVVRSTTVPATGASGQSLENPFGGILSGAKVFVPDESLEAYKAVWINTGTYNRLTRLSEYRREDYINV